MRKYFRFGAYLVLALWISAAQAGSYEDFFRAVVRDDAAAVQRLLQRGFDPNALDPEGRSGLMRALQDDSTKVAAVLVDWPQTDINWSNLKHETPLMIAAIKGDTELARKLIARGAYVNMPGWTPLHYAASGGHVDIIRMLLDASAYIDAESPNKTTPLMMAARYGSPEAVKLLLDAGADPTLRNELGLTALDFARRGERPDAIRMLSAIGAGTPSAALPAAASVTPPATEPGAAPAPNPAAGAAAAPAAQPVTHGTW